jgi:hypothetical protein
LSAALVLAQTPDAAAPPVSKAAQAARSIREAGLDPDACYRVRDLTFAREDLRFHLTDGFLVFGKPAEGGPISAVFQIETTAGDAEIVVFPPTRGDRASLVRFIDTPNLNERFHTAIFLFSDNTGAELLEQVKAAAAKPAPEQGVLLAKEWTPVVNNLAGSLEMRLLHDRLSGRASEQGLFYAAVSSAKIGNFDLIFDPQAREQITIGQIAYRENRTYFDIWTNYAARSWRNGRRKIARSPVVASDFRIEAELQPNFHLSAVTRMKIRSSERVSGGILFDLSRRMNLSRALLDGKPAEMYVRESMRSDLLRHTDNGAVMLVLTEPLDPERDYEVEFAHEGDVVLAAGEGVYFVGARTNWYPNHGATFANYELTFRYPKTLSLVATGELVEERTEGEWNIARRKTSGPIRFAGFNLGEYTSVSAERLGYRIDVHANRRVETALRQPRAGVVVVPQGWPRRQPDVVTVPLPPSAPNPAERLEQLAQDIGEAFEFMATHLGPPPLKTLTVSPIPGTFGQGFPGLVYLSTLSYIDPSERPAELRERTESYFYSEILHAHETAHQWFGNTVTSASYQDDWVMEALANYMALMYLEKERGRRSLDLVLEQYKKRLLAPDTEGRPLESAGPVIWGVRLSSSQAPGAWRIIVYEKGSWIMHMLRAQLGDAQFLKMLGELTKRYRYRPVSTEEFRKLAEEFLPKEFPERSLEPFFEQWVYTTGIPKLSLSSGARGKAPAVKVRGIVTQSEVDETFSTLVPVELQFAGKRSVTKWVRTSGEPVPFTVDARSAPSKVTLDPSNSILKR